MPSATKRALGGRRAAPSLVGEEWKEGPQRRDGVSPDERRRAAHLHHHAGEAVGGGVSRLAKDEGCRLDAQARDRD